MVIPSAVSDQARTREYFRTPVNPAEAWSMIMSRLRAIVPIFSRIIASETHVSRTGPSGSSAPRNNFPKRRQASR